MIQDQFARTRMLLGDQAMDRLQKSRVAVFGLGGVGGSAAEALARGGVGAIDVIDHDTVSETNLNRQLLATLDTLGMRKTAAAAARIHSVAPNCRVTAWPVFYLPETQEQFDFSVYDYVLDAVDTVKAKLALIEAARGAGVPIISAMGAGNKLDPTAFRVADLYDTAVCPLARVMRKECKKRGIERLKVVYSLEEPRAPETRADAGGDVRKDVPGSVSFVPGVMGMILAGEVIKDLTGIH